MTKPADEGMNEAAQPDHGAIAAWIDAQGDAPDDFADAVVWAWEQEAPFQPAQAAVPARAVSPRRWTVAVWAGLAAAALLLVLLPPSRGEMDDAAATGHITRLGAETGHDSRIDGEASESSPLADATLGALRRQMRGVLASRCVPCHRGGSDGAQAGALGVFDVSVDRWWTSMSADQLGEARTRLANSTGSDADQEALVDAFVAAELADRASPTG